MPELPEVETVRRGLEPFMTGKIVTRVELRRADLRIPFPVNLKDVVEGARVTHLSRRAKYLLIHLEGGNVVVVHLGMSGQMVAVEDIQSYPIKKHDHMIVSLKGGGAVVFNDPRRFGMVFLTDMRTMHEHASFRAIGPEPLGNEFSGSILKGRLQGKSTPIKIALLDQCVVAGVGNIYASEALYEAGISPLKKAGAVTARKAEDLASSIRNVLNRAIEAGGSTLKDFVKADGMSGYFQHSFAVYDKDGAPCPRCAGNGRDKSVIQKIVQGGRATYYCKTCQK